MNRRNQNDQLVKEQLTDSHKYWCEKVQNLKDDEVFEFMLFSDLNQLLRIEELFKQFPELRTERFQPFENQVTLITKIFKGEKEIGMINTTGEIHISRGYRKYAKEIAKSNIIVYPIRKYHTVLDWHTLKGKLHCLAQGDTVLHFIPQILTEERQKELNILVPKE